MNSLNKMDKVIRRNTLELRLAAANSYPGYEEFQEWMDVCLRIEMEHLVAIQYHPTRAIVYIKFKENDVLESTMKRLGEKVFMKTRKGDEIAVSVIRCDENDKKKTVKVIGLPVDLDNEDIVKSLENYGKVESITNGCHTSKSYRGLPNGIRLVSLILEKNVPSYLTINDIRATIVYKGQPRTCYNCDSEDHLKVDCPRLVSEGNYPPLHGERNQLPKFKAQNRQPNGIHHNLQMSDLFKKPVTRNRHQSAVNPGSPVSEESTGTLGDAGSFQAQALGEQQKSDTENIIVDLGKSPPGNQDPSRLTDNQGTAENLEPQALQNRQQPSPSQDTDPNLNKEDSVKPADIASHSRKVSPVLKGPRSNTRANTANRLQSGPGDKSQEPKTTHQSLKENKPGNRRRENNNRSDKIVVKKKE